MSKPLTKPDDWANMSTSAAPFFIESENDKPLPPDPPPSPRPPAGGDTTIMHIRHMRPSATPGGEALTTNLAAKWLQHLVGEIPWEDGPATPILRDHMAADATREQSALS